MFTVGTGLTIHLKKSWVQLVRQFTVNGSIPLQTCSSWGSESPYITEECHINLTRVSVERLTPEWISSYFLTILWLQPLTWIYCPVTRSRGFDDEELYFQQNVVLPLKCHLDIRAYLEAILPNTCFWWRESIKYHPRSADLKPLDVFMGIIKW